MERISIYVATHKKMSYSLPPIYKLCQVNAALSGHWDGYIYDDQNTDNISEKNYCYCELTAQYALWKNDNSDIKGLAHYRRFFSDVDFPTYSQYIYNRFSGSKIRESIINEEQIRTYLKDYDIILQWPYCPYYTSAYEDLTQFVYPTDIEVLISVIDNSFPEYKEALNETLSKTGISYLNMFIAKKDIFNQYSEWLFKVLNEVEEKTDISNYDSQHKRIYGYLSEVLLNVYVQYHKYKIKYVYMTEFLEKNEGKTIRLTTYMPQIMKLAWIRIRTDNYKRYDYLRRIANGKNKDNTLDANYRGVSSYKDVLHLMKRHKRFISTIKTLDVGTGELLYVESITCGKGDVKGYGAICIALIIIDSDEYIDEIISKIYDMYSANYTLNIRIINKGIIPLKDIRDKSGKRCFIINSRYNNKGCNL